MTMSIPGDGGPASGPMVRRFTVKDLTAEEPLMAQIEVSFTSPGEWALTIRGTTKDAFNRINNEIKTLPLSTMPSAVSGQDCLNWIEGVLVVAMDRIGQCLESHVPAGEGIAFDDDFLRDFLPEEDGMRFPFFATETPGR